MWSYLKFYINLFYLINAFLLDQGMMMALRMCQPNCNNQIKIINDKKNKNNKKIKKKKNPKGEIW